MFVISPYYAPYILRLCANSVIAPSKGFLTGLPGYTIEKLLKKAERLYDDTEKARNENTSRYPPALYIAYFVHPAADSLA